MISLRLRRFRNRDGGRFVFGSNACPRQQFLVSPIPTAPSVRILLHRPAYDPFASHPSLLARGTSLNQHSHLQNESAKPDATNSTVSEFSEPSRICHL